MTHDFDTVRLTDPQEFHISVIRGIVGGALFTFLGYLHFEDHNALLAALEKFAKDHGFDFDRTDARFWDEVVKANRQFNNAK